MPERRIRWTLIHEFGHYWLEHTEDSELADAEADFFAKNVLAPPLFVYHFNIKNYIELSEKFQLSNEASINSWNYYIKWLKKRNNSLTYEEKYILDIYELLN